MGSVKLGKDGTRYISYIPKRIDEGQILVHNFVPTGAQREHVGLDGFRIWLQRPEKRFKLCRCGFAPHIAAHYDARAWEAK
jgi:hypothetical protein